MDPWAVLLGLLITVFSLFYLYMVRNLDHWKKKGVPYIKPIPFVGNFLPCLLLKRSIGDFLADLYKRTKEDVLGFYVFDRPYLILRNPDLIKQVLVKDFSYFYDRVVSNNHEVDPIGSSILFLIKNPEWRITRLKMAPVFTSGKMKAMFHLIDEVGADLKDYLREKAVGKSSIECKEICSKYTTDVITSCAFGINAHSFKNEDAHMRAVGNMIYGFTSFSRGVQMNAYFFSPLLVKWLGLKFFDPFAAKYLKEVFLKTMAEREAGAYKRNDLIDTLIEINNMEEKPLDEDILVAQAAQFFVAGFETTSTTISSALYELCKKPQLQDHLRKEINSTLAKYDGKLCNEAVNEMKYLNQVVKETLRMYPSLPFLDRRAMENYQLPGTNIVIKKGTPLFIPLLGLHFDEQYFPDPFTFDPDRFSDENIAKVNPFTYMPFGNGPHNCIGERFGILSAKVGLIHMLSEFSVEIVPETPVPLQFDPKAFLIKPVSGIPMKFKDIAAEPA